jgi:hypothetical protein
VSDNVSPTIYLTQNNLVASVQGPSSSASSYLLPLANGVKLTSILTVPDAIGGYAMSGIPDGLGAFDNCDTTFTLLMNHELGNTTGVTRAHGSIGAYVSSWIISKSSLRVISGSDLMTGIYGWNNTTQSSNTTPGTFAFNRFCSADLPSVSAYYNAATGKGSRERIFMHGEEGGSTGYQLATVATGADKGKAYILGKFNLSTNGSGLTGVGGWENALANPYPQDKTVVIGNNDGGSGIMSNSVCVYVGTKQTTGSEVDKAGLTNGTLSFINVTGNAAEIVNTTTRATNITNGTRFTLSGTASTTFSRPEDGCWNPLNPNQFYFVTTDRLDQVSDGVGTQIGATRLWRLTFDSITNPSLGGVIDLLINGTVVNGVKVNMFDNLSADKFGNLILQEDVGNAAHNGKMWRYNVASNQLTLIAKHDPARFGDIGVAATSPFNQDEEASGVIDVSDILGAGMHLFVDQAHYSLPGAAVEGGQLMSMFVPSSVSATASTAADTVRAFVSTGCSTAVALGTPSTGDNCSVTSLTNNAPASFPVGTTNVIWTASDANGNSSTKTQVVIVADTVRPSITTPLTVVLYAGSNCNATTTLTPPVTTDNCTIQSVTSNAPATFNVGSTTVTWTATDVNGNVATATQQVAVIDTIRPTVVTPSTITVAAGANCTAVVNLSNPVASDNCSIQSISNNAPASFPIGTTVVIWTITDVNGNITTVNQNVVVTGTPVIYYADNDNDTFGDAANTTSSCSGVPTGYVTNSLDCNDGVAAINPAAIEICNNGIDDNCNGQIDEKIYNTTIASSCSSYTWTLNNQTYTTSGIYINTSNCNVDSLILTINNSSTSSTTITACDSYFWNGTTYTSSGVYTFPTTNAAGCDSIATLNLTINSIASYFVSAGTDQNVCANANVSLNGSISGGVLNATWSTLGTGSFSPSANVLNATYIPSSADYTNGSVSLVLTTNSVASCGSKSDTVVITLIALPASSASITGPTALCNPSTGAIFTYTAAPVVGATSYSWTVPAGVTIQGSATGASISVKFNASSVVGGISGSICVSANNANGCGNATPTCLPISVQTNAPVQPNSISGPDKACPGDVAVYSVAPVSRATSYNWSIPSNTTIINGAGTNVITLSFNAGFVSGNLSVAASNVCGTSILRSRSIFKNTLAAPAAISGVQFDGVCGATVTYTASVAGASSYSWTLPTGATGSSTTNSITVTYTNTFTTGTISVAGVNNCGVGNARSVTVKGAPGLPGVISGPTPICALSTNTYSIAVVQGATSYDWTVPTGVINFGQGTKTINMTYGSAVSPSGLITVKAVNACGTSATRILSVETLFCPRMGDATSTSGVSIYPNPANENVNIEFTADKAQNATITLTDATGRVVYTEAKEVSEGFNNAKINVKGFASGIYTLQLQSINLTQQFKVIVE